MKTPFLSQVLALLVAAALPSVASFAAESPSLLLQKGIYAEEIERNLDSAIKIYEQIATEAAASRSVVAQAQYRLAVCYQKKGNKEQAVAALHELLKQFPSETALSQQARERLAELGQSAESQTKIHQVALPPGSVVTLSADGRFTAYRPDGDPNAVVIRENATAKLLGTLRPATRISVLRFSHDGSRIAYLTASPGRAIYVASIDGSNPRKIYSDPKNVSLFGWSADPGRVVIVPWDTSPLQVKLLDTETGAQTEVADLPADMFFDAGVSPEGRYLTSRALPPGRGRSTISMIELASGRPITRVEKDLVAVVGWSEKASRLLFTSLRGGAVDLLALEMKDGHFVGEPEVIRRNVDHIEFKVADEGRLYCWETAHTEGVYVAAVDFATGALIAEPRLLPGRNTRYEADPLWSNDGNTLMLFTNEVPLRLVAVATATGLRREYPVSRNLDFKVGSYTWAENDSTLLVESFVGNVHGIYRYDLLSDRATPLALDDRNDHLFTTSPQLSRDGKSIYFLRYRAGSQGAPTNAQIFRKDLASAREEVIHTVNARLAYDLRLSPDGSKFAYRTDQNKIAVVDARGGAERALAALPNTIRSVTWTPDGKRIVFINRPNGVRANQIVTVDVETKVRVTMQLGGLEGYLKEIAVHPDGRQVAFRASTGSDENTLWVMEGFLAKRAATAKPPASAVLSSPAESQSEEIPLQVLQGPNNSLLDRKLGFSATLPQGWTISHALRTPFGGNVVTLTAGAFPEAAILLSYRSTSPWATAPTPSYPANFYGPKRPEPGEVDAWLRDVAQRFEQVRLSQNPDAAKNLPAEYTSRVIGGRKALSWFFESLQNETKQSHLSVLIYGENAFARIGLMGPAASVEAARPTFEKMIETVRLP